jgi:hypothetical protein
MTAQMQLREVQWVLPRRLLQKEMMVTLTSTPGSSAGTALRGVLQLGL